MVAGFETAERFENLAVAVDGVCHGEVVEVLVGLEGVAVGVERVLRIEAGGLVLKDGGLHNADPETAPLGEGELVNEAAFDEVAGPEIGAGGVEKIVYIDYKNVPRLKRFTTERGKILPRRTTGSCASHQRELTAAIKRAREIAFLPFVAEQS